MVAGGVPPAKNRRTPLITMKAMPGGSKRACPSSPSTALQKARVSSRFAPPASATCRRPVGLAATPLIASHGETGAAAAGRDRVRILDLEGLAHQIVDEIDDGATQIDERQLVDQDGGAVLLDGDIVVVALADEIEFIGEARAAAALDGNAQGRLAGFLGDDRCDAPGGSIRHVDLHLGLGVSAHRDIPETGHLAFAFAS